uniref:non-specific serine/threonine protein kinase n=1 Tax=Denticeps clupeoides TaxID=299321 RepID=A0AAY4DBZ6_9TELE
VARSGRLPEKQCQDMFHQMVQAVRYLHSNNISHRDLKCDNILLTHELSTTFCGTPCYLAPEVLQQKPYDPKKADIWSLGMVLYYMAIGAKPFNTSSVNALLKMQAAPLHSWLLKADTSNKTQLYTLGASTSNFICHVYTTCSEILIIVHNLTKT